MKRSFKFLVVDDDQHAGSNLASRIEQVWFPRSTVVLVSSESDARNLILGANGQPPPAFDLAVLDRQLRYGPSSASHPTGLPERDAGLRLLADIRASPLKELPVVIWSVLGADDSKVSDDPKVDYVSNVNDRAPLYSSMRSMLAATNSDLPPIPTSLESRRTSTENKLLRLAGAIGALALIVGFLTGAASWLWRTVFPQEEAVAFEYVAVPPVVAVQYAFPDESFQSSGAGLLASGTQVEVVCRWDTPSEPEKSWVLLSGGTWLRGSEVLPAATESVGLESLPLCDVP